LSPLAAVTSDTAVTTIALRIQARRIAVPMSFLGNAMGLPGNGRRCCCNHGTSCRTVDLP
jgi:hypothetical protein